MEEQKNKLKTMLTELITFCDQNGITMVISGTIPVDDDSHQHAFLMCGSAESLTHAVNYASRELMDKLRGNGIDVMATPMNKNNVILN